MILKRLKLLDHNNHYDISINGSKITSISKSSDSDSTGHVLQNAMALPGLINSHDHLDFNLFPRLGNTVYKNYTDWGRSIHSNYKKEIEDILRIPETLRFRWGLYKNLIAGVTSVNNHGKQMSHKSLPLNLIDKGQCLHSVAFEKNWKWKLNNPLKIRSKCIIHSGEGIDDAARTEVSDLTQNNYLKRELIAVHGIAMTPDQSNHFSALVWCPQSNFFMFKRTADIKVLKNSVPVILGTDSTLTSDWNIWDHLRTARSTGFLSDKELFESVTSVPADVWKLSSGRLLPGKNADIIITDIKDENNSCGSFFENDPQKILMVITNGKIRMFDIDIRDKIEKADLTHSNWGMIKIQGSIKYVPKELISIYKEIKNYNASVQFPFSLV
jgi:hypothetical protein